MSIDYGTQRLRLNWATIQKIEYLSETYGLSVTEIVRKALKWFSDKEEQNEKTKRRIQSNLL